MSSAESVWSRRGSESGRPTALPVRLLFTLRPDVDGDRRRLETEGEADGDVDMRSCSAGSSEAFLLRPDML